MITAFIVFRVGDTALELTGWGFLILFLFVSLIVGGSRD